MLTRRPRTLAAAFGTTALLIACSSETTPSLDDGSAPIGTTTTVATGPDGAPTTSPQPGADQATDVTAPRSGTWAVGDAGEVDFAVTDGALVLLDVRANDGWQVSVDVESAREIEVDFERGNIDWQIEIEYENQVLEIEIDQDIDPAEPGVVAAGVAGSVEFDLADTGLILVDVVTNAGWDATVTDERPDEIEVLFRSGLAEYVVEIERDDGRIEVEVDFEVEGAYP